MNKYLRLEDYTIECLWWPRIITVSNILNKDPTNYLRIIRCKGAEVDVGNVLYSKTIMRKSA